jgi:hypothetical protein
MVELEPKNGIKTMPPDAVFFYAGTVFPNSGVKNVELPAKNGTQPVPPCTVFGVLIPFTSIKKAAH